MAFALTADRIAAIGIMAEPERPHGLRLIELDPGQLSTTTPVMSRRPRRLGGNDFRVGAPGMDRAVLPDLPRGGSRQPSGPDVPVEHGSHDKLDVEGWHPPTEPPFHVLAQPVISAGWSNVSYNSFH